MSRQQMPTVDGKYGAPMGRHGHHQDYAGAKARCFRLRFVDGCYDDGGAYWGSPANVYAVKGEGILLFTRAKSRAAAKAVFREKVPELKFIN